MKKFYKIFFLSITLIFLSTFNPNKYILVSKNKNNFFKIEDIVIKNNYLLKEKEIQEKLISIYDKNIILIKRKDIEQPLKNLYFLERIEVKKKYPSTLIVKIFETKPVGILFKNKNRYFLDNLSNLIPIQENMNFKNLPNIFGNTAENHFLNFFKKLEKNNFPIKKIKNFYYFQIGRWDLELFNGKTIKLPHYNTDVAIKKSAELLIRKDFKNYNIIDMRVDGKIIVE